MPAGNVLESIFAAGFGEQLKDPGSGGVITVNRSPAYMGLRSAGAEARTMPVPTVVGVQVMLACEVAGGTITVTVASAHNETGDTTLVFTEAGQWYKLESVKLSATVFGWRLVSHYGIANASPAESGALNGLTATVAEINVAADGSANTVVVAAGGAAVTPLAGGGTYLIPLVTANVTMTLPAATLGEKHRLCFIGSAADAEDWVITSPTLLVGGFSHFDVGGTSAAAYANGSSHTIVTVNNPAAGTDITFIGDGTNWACTGQVSSADIHAFS